MIAQKTQKVKLFFTTKFVLRLKYAPLRGKSKGAV
jgi:hypothetical protein